MVLMGDVVRYVINTEIIKRRVCLFIARLLKMTQDALPSNILILPVPHRWPPEDILYLAAYPAGPQPYHHLGRAAPNKPTD